MKSTISEQREKQPATRGVVLGAKGAKPKGLKRGCRGARVTLRLTASETAELTMRAEAAGLSLSPYIRREVLRSSTPLDPALLLVEIVRGREQEARLWVASGEEPLDIRAVQQIVAQVDAIDPRVLLAKALGKKL